MLKRWAWTAVKPFVVEWLSSRALVLPATKAAEMAARLKVPIETVYFINAELKSEALAELDQFKP